jgi:hypothetical protein
MRAGGWAVIGFLCLAGCRDTEGEGLGCVSGSDECGEGLKCVDGECVDPTEHPPRPKADEYLISVKPARSSLAANRADTLDVRVEARYADGKPYKGKLLVRTEPYLAATADPGVIELRGGLGASRLTGCRASDPECPPWFRVDVALEDAPAVVIGHSAGFVRLAGVPEDRPWIFGTIAGSGARADVSGATAGGTNGSSKDEISKLRSPSLDGAPSCQGIEWRTTATQGGVSAVTLHDRGEDVDVGDESISGRFVQALGATFGVRDRLVAGTYTANDGAYVHFGGEDIGPCTLTRAIVVEKRARSSVGSVNAVLVAATGTCAVDGDPTKVWRAGACWNALR